jgi:hypothetical protein
MIRALYSNQLSQGALENFPIGQTDIARLQRGMVGSQFWSAYVPWLDPTTLWSRSILRMQHRIQPQTTGINVR